jgi:hypothetical protein
MGEPIFSLDIVVCTSAMETEPRQLAGILSVELNNVAGTLRVNFDPSKTASEVICYYLKQLCQEEQTDDSDYLRRPKTA